MEASCDERSLFGVERWNHLQAMSPSSSNNSDFDAPPVKRSCVTSSFDAARFRRLKALAEEKSYQAEQERTSRWKSLTASDEADRRGRGVSLPDQTSPEELNKIILAMDQKIAEKVQEEDDVPTLDTTVEKDDDDDADAGTSVDSTDDEKGVEAFPLSARKETLEALAQLSQKYWNVEPQVTTENPSLRLPSLRDGVQQHEEATSSKTLFAWKCLFETSCPPRDKTPQQSIKRSTPEVLLDNSRPPLLKLASSALSGNDDDESRSSSFSWQQEECATTALLQLGCLLLGQEQQHETSAESRDQHSQCSCVVSEPRSPDYDFSELVEEEKRVYAKGSVCGTCSRALLLLFIGVAASFIMMALENSEVELPLSEEQQMCLSANYNFPTFPEMSKFLKHEGLCLVDELELKVDDINLSNSSFAPRVLSVSISTSTHATKTVVRSLEAFTQAMKQISSKQYCHENETVTLAERKEAETPILERVSVQASETGQLVLGRSTALVQNAVEASKESDFDHSQDYTESDYSVDFCDGESEMASLLVRLFSDVPTASVKRISGASESSLSLPWRPQEEIGGHKKEDDCSSLVIECDEQQLEGSDLAQQVTMGESGDTEPLHQKKRVPFWRRHGGRVARTISRFFRGRRKRPRRNDNRSAKVHASVLIPNSANGGPLEGHDDEFLRVPLSQVVAAFFEERKKMGLD